MTPNSTEHYKLMDLELDRVDLVTAGANPGAHILIAKFDTDATLSDKTAETPDVQPQEVDKKMAEDVKDAVETVAKADFEALQTQLAEQIAKAEADAAAHKAEIEKAATLEARIAKMETERKQAEFVAKAKEFSNLGKADELGAMLLQASEGMSPEAYQLLERTMKAANAQVDKGALFAQFSKGDGEPESFEEKVESLAKAKVEAGHVKTIEMAKLQVLNENPGLRAEYRQSR